MVRCITCVVPSEITPSFFLGKYICTSGWVYNFIHMYNDAAHSTLFRVHLSTQFEGLLPYLESMIPESKKSFLTQFVSHVSMI